LKNLMISRYKILYEIIHNKLPNINIEYIKHYKYFKNNKIQLFYPLLIPNNSTFKVIYIFKNLYSYKFTLLVSDLGSGTGIIFSCINIKFKNIFYNLIDKSYLSVKTIRKNIKRNTYDISIWGNWSYLFLNIKKYNIIISNPPYISYYDFPYYFNYYSTEVKNGLLSPNSGFIHIYNIIKFSYDLLHINGIILLEHNYSQGKKIRSFMHCCGFNNIFTYKDLNKLNRITYAEK